MLSIIIDPQAVGGRDKVAHEASVLTDWIKASRQRQPGVEVLMPGEPERIARAEHTANGIAVDARTLDELIEAGCSLGIERATLLQILS